MSNAVATTAARNERGSWPPATRHRLGLQSLFFVSGGPGLLAQLAWTRVFTAGLGHEMPSLVGVVSAFFVGLAAGAWVLEGRLRRSECPVRWYAGLEWFSAGWILVTTPLLTSANEWARALVGVDASWVGQLAVAFGLPLLVVGPAAAALGGTLPAMERVLAPWLADGRAVAGLYALNTAGAVVGVLAGVAWIMPGLGFRSTLLCAAAVQAICGTAAWWLGRSGPARQGAVVAPVETVRRPLGRRTLATAWGSGLLGMGYELLGVRALAQTTENTVQTFAAGLAVFLSGTAAGAALSRVASRRGLEPGIPLLLGGLAFAVLGELWILEGSAGLLDHLRTWLGRGVGAELGLALAVFGLPTLLMGALFSRVVQGAGTAADGVGRAVAANTLGGALAAPLFLVVALPQLGLKWALVAVALGYLLLLPRPRRVREGVLPVLVLGCLPFLPARLQWIELPPGAELRRYDEGLLATVAVVRTVDGHRTLRVNNHFQQGGTATAMAARRHAHLPLLLHPDPRTALFLGVGTGITLGAAGAHPNLRADAVELLPEVVAALPEFEPENGAPQRRPGFRVRTGDARRFVRTTTNLYDVVIADLFHPAEDGAGFLYTREHFAALRERAAPGGLVCQWLPLHQLELDTFRDITRTFLEIFPGATLWLLRFNVDVPVVGLIGATGELNLEAEGLSRRLTEPGLAAALRPVGLTEAIRVLGCQLADAASLVRMAGSGPVATDDRPLVLFRAAAAAYRPDPRPHRRFIDLLGEADPGFARRGPARLGSAVGGDRLEAFRAARDQHLRGLAREADGQRREALEDYLASAAASADYTAGYAQAVLVASAYAREDPASARRLLERLIQARPDQRLAGDLLERLGR